MNFKKIISLSFAALCVAGALCACSKDDVSGADVQDNSLAENSSSSVTPRYSSSFDKNEFLARLGNLTPGVPVINVGGVIDSVNAREIFNNIVDSILKADSILVVDTIPNVDSMLKNVVPIEERGEFLTKYEEFIRKYDEEQRDKFIDIDFVDEDSTLFSFVFGKGRFSCSFSINILDDIWGSEFYDHKIEKTGDSLMMVRTMLVDDSSVVEQFKNDCIADNGSFGVNMVVIYPIYDEPLEQWPIGHKCSLRASLTDSVYKDPYWEKYISKVLDRCIVDFSDN